MKKILTELKGYWSFIDKRVLFLSMAFTAVLVFVNYYYSLNKIINAKEMLKQLFCWYGVLLIAFSFSYLLQELYKPSGLLKQPKFILLLLTAPALFAWKMSATIHFNFSADDLQNSYWNQVVYWPIKLFILTFLLFLIWKLVHKNQPFYGLSIKGFNAAPYLLMLLIMLPLVSAAATQPDFLAMYPKFKNIAYLKEDQPAEWWHILLYELSYGSDFFTIELFFRGFLILGFVKWAGKHAILPMALFYCAIHFGKPLAECISSFFGGLILGVVTYHTRSIFGGLIVHLGIAWMMELAGWIGSRI